MLESELTAYVGFPPYDRAGRQAGRQTLYQARIAVRYALKPRGQPGARAHPYAARPQSLQTAEPSAKKWRTTHDGKV